MSAIHSIVHDSGHTPRMPNSTILLDGLRLRDCDIELDHEAVSSVVVLVRVVSRGMGWYEQRHTASRKRH